ncbi:protein of unknown function [Chryseobacterium sp. JV274]|nr:protein of unknown function [Chryseobacterium sp. JV274]
MSKGKIISFLIKKNNYISHNFNILFSQMRLLILFLRVINPTLLFKIILN